MREIELGGAEYSERLQEMRNLPEKDARDLVAMRMLKEQSSARYAGDSTPPRTDGSSGERLVNGVPAITVNGDLGTDGSSDKHLATATGHTNSVSQVGADETATGHTNSVSQVGADETATSGNPHSLNGKGPGEQHMDTRDASNATQDALSFLSQGGMPWYVEHFEPMGMSLHEERWTGPEVVRGMSEELSEMDEQELQGLGPASEVEESDDTAAPEVPTTRAARSTRRR